MLNSFNSPVDHLFESGRKPSTLVELLRLRSVIQPTLQAYTYLEEGEKESTCLTYAQLDRQARKISAVLQSYTMNGDRALLLSPPGLDYIAAFFGCLYAGVVAVPAYPPRMNRSLATIHAIAPDCA